MWADVSVSSTCLTCLCSVGVMLIMLCHGFMPLISLYACVSWSSYLLSSRVVHWRANSGLFLSYPTIYNTTSIMLIF